MSRNNKNYKDLFLVFGLLILLVFPLPASSETVKEQEIKSIIEKFDKNPAVRFDNFLSEVINYTKNPILKKSVSLFRKNIIKENDDWINIYRLLGIYSRIKYKNELISTLDQLVSIPTFKKEDLPQFENPEIIKFGEKIKEISLKFGLEYKNIDNRIFEVTLPGNSEDSFGVYTHSDVLPAGSTSWRIEGGKEIDPFRATITGDKIYGRGTEDDKCSIVVSLYAMKIIKENGFKINRAIRLIIETTEETSGEGIKYYKNLYKVPDYNIVLDSAYPVVTAEKAYGSISAKFKLTPGIGNGPEILNITGGIGI